MSPASYLSVLAQLQQGAPGCHVSAAALLRAQADALARTQNAQLDAAASLMAIHQVLEGGQPIDPATVARWAALAETESRAIETARAAPSAASGWCALEDAPLPANTALLLRYTRAGGAVAVHAVASTTPQEAQDAHPGWVLGHFACLEPNLMATVDAPPTWADGMRAAARIVREGGYY